MAITLLFENYGYIFLLGERRFTLFTSGMGALNYKSQVVTISLDG